MKRIRLINILWVSIIVLVSCNQDSDDLPKQTGFLRFNVTFTDDVVLPVSKSSAINTGNFMIKIKSVEEDQYVYESLMSKIPDVLELTVGTYLLEASYPEIPKEAAFEQPYFWGEIATPIQIKADEISELASINCSLQNMKVTVEYGSTIVDWFDDYSVTVGIEGSETNKLEYTRSMQIPGYFAVKPLTVHFWGKRKETGDIIEKDFPTIRNVGTAFHHTIKVNADYDYSVKSVKLLQ